MRMHAVAGPNLHVATGANGDESGLRNSACQGNIERESVARSTAFPIDEHSLNEQLGAGERYLRPRG
ncbi:MAG: hypothetical protein ACRENI_03930 [Gemmatimonadaceae bacterium]